jgi:adenylate kinase family enzyme
MSDLIPPSLRKDLRKICIFGNLGSGKTDLALRLSQELQIPLCHLDRLIWTSKGELSDRRDFRSLHAQVVESYAWIIEGLCKPELEYPHQDIAESDTLMERARAADLVIFLDVPLLVCVGRMLRRRIDSILRPQPKSDLPDGRDYTFNVFIVNLARHFKARHLPEILSKVADVQNRGPKKLFVRIRHRSELAAALEKTASGGRPAIRPAESVFFRIWLRVRGVQRLIQAPLRAWSAFLWHFKRRSPDRRKEVLLFGSNDAALITLRAYRALLQDRDDLRFSFVTDRPFRHLFKVDPVTRIDGVENVSLLRTLTRPWDLILFAEHPSFRPLFSRIPQIFVSHGICNGKLQNGDSYGYGSRCLKPDGEPRYDKIMVAGASDVENANKVNPILGPRLRVVGDLMADELARVNARRGEVRRRFGIPDGRRAVVLFSTWGPDSLIGTSGRALLPELRRLAADYSFLVCYHPKIVFDPDPDGRFKEYLDGVRADPRLRLSALHEPWQEALAAADLAIGDYSSMSLYFATLCRPLIQTPFDLSEFIESSPVLELRRRSPVFDALRPLEEQIERALREFKPEGMAALARRLSVSGGGAGKRARAEVLSLLP